MSAWPNLPSERTRHHASDNRPFPDSADSADPAVSPHRVEWGRDNFGFDTSFRLARRLVRLVVQTMRLPDQDQSFGFAPSQCLGCGVAGVQGYCAACRADMTARAREAFWDKRNW